MWRERRWQGQRFHTLWWQMPNMRYDSVCSEQAYHRAPRSTLSNIFFWQVQPQHPHWHVFWTNLQWANIFLNVVQHRNYVVPVVGGYWSTAVLCAISCKQNFCIQKQSAESTWSVPPLGVSPTLWTKSFYSSKGYGHVKTNHCINVKVWLQSWWKIWIPPRPAHMRPLICWFATVQRHIA